MAKKKAASDSALTLFDVPATKVVYAEPKAVKDRDLVRSFSIDVSRMGLVAITEGKCDTFKVISDSFGNKLTYAKTTDNTDAGNSDSTDTV